MAIGAGSKATATQINNELGVAQQNRSAVAFGTSTSTSFTPTLAAGGVVAGVAFVAPTSGKVTIVNGCYFWNSGANTTLVGFHVRTGAVVGSGTTVNGPTDNESNLSNGTNGFSLEKSYILSGLTAGATYNVQQEVRVSAGTGTFNRHYVLALPTT